MYVAAPCQVHVAHGEAAKAMQAYIRKIEEEAPEDESMEIQEGEQAGQQTITIAAEDGGEEQTVYQMSDGTYQAVVTDASHVSYLSCPSGSSAQVKNTRGRAHCKHLCKYCILWVPYAF